jgi:hypothetical protein
MSKLTPRICIGCITVIVAAVGLRGQNAAQKLLVGNANVETITSYKGPAPLPKPNQILVYDFAVPPNVVTMDQSMAARLRRRHLAMLGRNSDSSPEAVVRQVQASFSKALVKELQKTSIPAETATGTETVNPAHTLIVQGEFTAINEGNKSKRIMIGFGRGASDVQAHVTVSLTGGAQPIVLSEFKLNSASGKKPGAAAMMGVGSAGAGVAAGSVGDTKATVKADASRMAKAVAKQIQSLMAAQKWITPQPASSK